MERTIVIWGAGRIGRGFVADIADVPGWKTVFVDIDRELVDALNERKQYTVFKEATAGVTKKIMTGFRAVHTGDQAALTALFEEPDLTLDIAVHAPKLEEVADMVAPLIAHRARVCPQLPMDVWMNVNMSHPDERFISLMGERLEDDARSFFDAKVGVTGIFAMCISPLATALQREEDPLALQNNGFFEQAIDETRLKCPAPVMPRLRLCRNVEREETRKLYTLNMAHALLCFLGLPLGLKTSCEAVHDPRLRPVLEEALSESGFGLVKAYGFGEKEMEDWSGIIIELLENPYIVDDLQRLGADTRRKLGPWDRLAGPARLCFKYGRQPEALCRAIGSGFFYQNPDEGTQAVQDYCRAHGVSAAIARFCELPQDDPLHSLILRHLPTA